MARSRPDARRRDGDDGTRYACAVTVATLIVFVVVYLGLALGKLPKLALDRTGVALLGAIAMVLVGAVPYESAWAAVDMPTVFLLFAMMVISAQFRLAGSYSAITRRIVATNAGPRSLLFAVMLTSALLSAVLTNDVVCLAMTPVVIDGCARRRLNPVPFLLGLACSSNIGSAATLIGNPQNILIGQKLELSFSRFLLEASVPVLLSLWVAWLVIVRQFRDGFTQMVDVRVESTRPFDRYQTAKGLLVTLGLLIAFLFFASWPREGIALTCAAVVLLSRRMASREMLGLVDWQLLVLFIGLFVVNDGFARSGLLEHGFGALLDAGVDLSNYRVLFLASAVLSNLVSNVPATMLLLPVATTPSAAMVLALSSTLAGNLFIVGSIANIIVVAGARSAGVEITFRKHLSTGVPVTVATLAIAALWLEVLR